MKALMQCNTCFKRGNSEWAGWHRAHIHDTSFTLYGEENEPPSKSNKSLFKFHILGSGSLHSSGFGGWGNTQSRYPFHSLVHFCVNR